MKLTPGKRFYLAGFIRPWVTIDEDGKVHVFQQRVSEMIQNDPGVLERDIWLDYDADNIAVASFGPPIDDGAKGDG